MPGRAPGPDRWGRTRRPSRLAGPGGLGSLGARIKDSDNFNLDSDARPDQPPADSEATGWPTVTGSSTRRPSRLITTGHGLGGCGYNGAGSYRPGTDYPQSTCPIYSDELGKSQ
jgi:hypothetical protein